VKRLFLIGGGGRSRIWSEIVCNIFNLPLTVPSPGDASFGAALLAAGVYLTGYVFNGAIVRMPDLLLTAGATLAAFALALLLLWTGISIAVAGCTLTVRLTRSIYRAILYPKKEEDADE